MELLSFLQTEVFPALFKGFKVSLLLIVPSAVLGLCVGIVVGTARVYGNRTLSALANAFVTLFRGVPLVVQLFFWYFGLPYVGIYLSPVAASILGFSLCSGAYHSEYIRGALLSIKTGQMLAAQALGFSKMQMIVSVILPQAMRRALPGCGNEIIYLIKYSSLAYMITCIEMTGEAKVLASHSFRYTEVFLAVGACYLLIVSVASWVLQRVEDRFRIPGFEHRKV
ncbi:MAG: amino acid ABC transporter permease [Desulfobacteraceae bacterium]|nr:amino acid ABC transporter permease [Desulfobacteraceae bacterium]